MSDLAIFARQGDLTRSSSMTQKRPLSIITENDSDDPDVTDCSKYRQCVCSSGEESKSRCSENTSSSNQASNDRNTISAHADHPEPSVCSTSVVDRDGSSEASLLSVKSVLAGTQSSGHTAKSKRSTSSTSPSYTKNSTSELKSGYRSDINENKILDEPLSRLPSDNAKLARSKAPETDISRHQLYSQSAIGNHNQVQALCEMTQTNSICRSKPSGDSPSLARSRGKADRQNLLSVLSPTFPPSSSPSSTMLKFGPRSWTQPSPPRTLQQPSNSTGHTYPQISVTTNEGKTLVVSLSLTSSPDSDDCCDNSTTTKWLSDISDHKNGSQPHLNRAGISSNSTPNSSKLSSCFSRRMSNESIGSESDLSDGDIGSDESSMNYLSYFRRLKETTDRLRLSTRRPSIMLWRQQFMECQTSSVRKSSQSGDASDDRLTLDRKQRIDLALEWLRNQLQEMRSQDQNLAKQLLAIRHDIHKLKLQRSTEEHQELIDDFQFELQELQEFSDVLDLPLPEYADNPLKHIGVTRLNISARRFSAC